MNRRTLASLSALVCISIILASLGPFPLRNALPMTTTINLFGCLQLTVHRLTHFVAFGLQALTLTLIGRQRWQRLLCLAATIGFGCLIEAFEFMSSTNIFEFSDVRDDSLAALAGFVIGEALLLSAFHDPKGRTRT